MVLAASKGLGKATALEFAREGANVMISSRHEEQLRAAAYEIAEITGNSVAFQVCDVTNRDEVKSLVQATANKFGTIHALVNNAGGPPAGTFDDFSDEDWQKAFELNLLSVVRTIREVLPFMRNQKEGRIVNIASSSFKQPIEGLILSNVFRTGIVGLAKTLSMELAADNILINTVGPGRIATERMVELERKRAETLGLSMDEVRKETEAQIPLGRYGTPQEFARFIVFLCSGANTYITGQSILVDGGLVRAI